jgi:hypothetical protein
MRDNILEALDCTGRLHMSAKPAVRLRGRYVIGCTAIVVAAAGLQI